MRSGRFLILIASIILLHPASSMAMQVSPPADVQTIPQTQACPDGSIIAASDQCPAPPPPPPPPPPSSSPPRGYIPIATRLFVPPSFKLPSRVGAFGVLVFSGGPADAKALDRYLRICETYLKVFDDGIDVEYADPDAVQMVTVWPRTDLKKPLSFDPDTDDAGPECRRAVSHYSYVTAHLWMRRMEGGGSADLLSRGPYLLAVARGANGRNSPATVLDLDLSAMDSTAEIENAFHLWINEIEANPRTWRSAWRPQRWKLYVASRLNQYGKQVFDAITILRHSAIME